MQVNQAGDVGGVPPWPGCKERGFVHSQCPYPVGTSRVIHQRQAMINYRGHDRVPADPEVSGDLGDRTAQLADLPAGVCSSPFSHRMPGPHNIIAAFSPGPFGAQRFGTAPDPFGPHQPGGPAHHRQIAHLNGPAVMRGRFHPTLRTTCRSGRFDVQPHLANRQPDRAQRNAVYAEHDSAQRRIVNHP